MDSLVSFKKKDATLFCDLYLRENHQNVKPHSSLLHAKAKDQVNQYRCNSSSQGAFFTDFIYLFDRDRDSQRERKHSRGIGRGRSRLIAEEPDMGLDPRTP